MTTTRIARIAAVVLGFAVMAFVTIAACGASAVAASTPTTALSGPQPNSVTWIGNSGFLIWTGNRKILVDAVFDGNPSVYTLPAAVKEPLLGGKPPFDAIGIGGFFVSHSFTKSSPSAAVALRQRARLSAARASMMSKRTFAPKSS